MTKDDIIRMAREAGLGWVDADAQLERFATLVAAAERKRSLDAAECCRMCEHKGVRHEQTKGDEID